MEAVPNIILCPPSPEAIYASGIESDLDSETVVDPVMPHKKYYMDMTHLDVSTNLGVLKALNDVFC